MITYKTCSAHQRIRKGRDVTKSDACAKKIAQDAYRVPPALLNLARIFILLTLTFFRFRQHYTVCLKSVQQDQKNYSRIDC